MKERFDYLHAASRDSVFSMQNRRSVHFISALHSKRGVVQRLQPRLRSSSFSGSPDAIFSILRRGGGNRHQETRHEVDAPLHWRPRFAAARYAHQDVNVVIMVSLLKVVPPQYKN